MLAPGKLRSRFLLQQPERAQEFQNQGLEVQCVCEALASLKKHLAPTLPWPTLASADSLFSRETRTNSKDCGLAGSRYRWKKRVPY